MSRRVPGFVVAALAGLGISHFAAAQQPAPPTGPAAAQPPAHATPGAHAAPRVAEAPAIVDLTPVDLPERPRCSTPIDCVTCNTCNNRSAGLTASIEYLAMRLRRTSNDYVIVDPIDNLAPEGSIQNVPFDDTSGFRASVGYRFRNSDWGTVFTYTNLNTNGDRAAIAPPGGLLYATLTRPGLVDNVAFAAANAGVNLNVFDFETARAFQFDDSFVARLSFGPRFANMSNTMLGAYFGGNANGTVARSRTEFDGVGLTTGVHGEWIFTRGIRFFGRAHGSIIMSDFNSSFTETDNNGQTINAAVTESYRMTVPVIELASGVAWECRNIRIAVGYEIQNWFNVVNDPMFIDDFAEGKLGRRQSDLGIEGFFAQFGLVF